MAGRPRKPNQDELREQFNPDVKAPSSRSSTMGLDRALANRVREIAHEHNLSALDVLNKLVEYALEHASFKAERVEVQLRPKDLRKPRGS